MKLPNEKTTVDARDAKRRLENPLTEANMQNMVIWYPYSPLGNEVGWAGVSGNGGKAKG
jgi:hypothetical protein